MVRSICGISKASAIQLHREIWGTRPVSGLLPNDPDWLVKVPKNAIHGSVFFNIYKTISQATKASKAEVYLAAYELYEETVKGEEVALNINRAWQLVQQISMNELVAVTCKRCSINYASLRTFPIEFRFCPVCDSETYAPAKLKWKNDQSIDKLNRQATLH